MHYINELTEIMIWMEKPGENGFVRDLCIEVI